MKIKILNNRLDLNIALNHLLFRTKLDDISEEKRETILRDAKGIENALELIYELENKIEEQYSINMKLHLENLRLKKVIEEMTRKEIEL